MRVHQAAKPPSGFLPTPADLKNTFRKMFNAAKKNHTAEDLGSSAPKGWSEKRAVNFSLPGMDREGCNINGILYVKTKRVTPSAHPEFFKVGRVEVY